MAGGEQTEAALNAEESWWAAIEHAAGCPDCRTPGVVCQTGERLLSVYETAAQLARAEEST
ncbi:hypothetical protein GA0115260_102326 [Streptomyces sp. MnatMP-M27]|nr:hypothetical protein GA0115260_102326 [Streptomyces sp. MnatMP-M27]